MGSDYMSNDEDIDEIRKKKAEELLNAHHNDELPPQILPWSFRYNLLTLTHEIVQNNERVVAITTDPNWAKLVCDMLNSVLLAGEGQQ